MASFALQMPPRVAHVSRLGQNVGNNYLDMTLFSLNIVILRGLTFSQILIGFNKFKSYSHDEISREFSILPGVSLWYVSVCLGCLYGMSVCAKGACIVCQFVP